MDKILPVIKMPEKEPEAELAPMTGHRLPDMPNDNQLIQDIIEDNMAGQQESELSPEIDGDDIIQVDERIIPSEDDVFNEPAPRLRPSAPTVAPVRPLEEDEESIPHGEPMEYTPKKGKRKYVRKAPMSDKQKAHLEKIRKISLEKRAQKKLEKEEDKKRKEEEKEDLRIQKAQERLLAKQKKEQAIINQDNSPGSLGPPSPQKAQRAQQGAMFTQADMEKAMYSAISSYETIRKKEKADKKQQELANARENQMRRTLEAAIRPQAPPDPWRQFFS